VQTKWRCTSREVFGCGARRFDCAKANNLHGRIDFAGRVKTSFARSFWINVLKRSAAGLFIASTGSVAIEDTEGLINRQGIFRSFTPIFSCLSGLYGLIGRVRSHQSGVFADPSLCVGQSLKIEHGIDQLVNAFVCQLLNLFGNYFKGIPEFIMEVLSPFSRAIDRGPRTEIYRRAVCRNCGFSSR
jgi:hypothetical protein